MIIIVWNIANYCEWTLIITRFIIDYLILTAFFLENWRRPLHWDALVYYVDEDYPAKHEIQ